MQNWVANSPITAVVFNSYRLPVWSICSYNLYNNIAHSRVTYIATIEYYSLCVASFEVQCRIYFIQTVDASSC
jgi:hypothetical protein